MTAGRDIICPRDFFCSVRARRAWIDSSSKKTRESCAVWMEGLARNTHVENTCDAFCKMLLIPRGLDVRSIPSSFLPTFGGEYLEAIKLKICKAYSWDVELKKQDGKVILDEGWLDFVKAHDLKVGYFLVFKKLATTSFKVIVFDHDNCEKVIRCAGYHPSFDGQFTIS